MKTLLGAHKLGRLVVYVKLSNQIEGSIAEVGVYKGGSAEAIAKNKRSDKRLFLFDTFEGMPETCDKDNYHKRGDFADTSMESVQAGLAKYKNVHIHKGLFPQDTGHFVAEERFSLVHIDVDIYRSYMDTLEFLWPRVVRGGVVVMDDYNGKACLGAKAAVDEFFSSRRESLVWACQSQVCVVKGSD